MEGVVGVGPCCNGSVCSPCCFDMFSLCTVNAGSSLLFRPVLFHARQRLMLYVVLLFMSESNGYKHALPPLMQFCFNSLFVLFFSHMLCCFLFLSTYDTNKFSHHKHLYPPTNASLLNACIYQAQFSFLVSHTLLWKMKCISLSSAVEEMTSTLGEVRLASNNFELCR